MTNMMLQGNLKCGLGRSTLTLVVSAAFMFLAVRGVQWDEVVYALKQTNVPTLVLAAAGTLAAQFFRTLRWRMILRPALRIGSCNLYAAAIVGMMANFLLPARMGDVVSAYVLKRSDGASMSVVLTTIVLERIFDLLTILLLLLVLVTQLSVPGWLRTGGWIAFASCAVLLMTFLFMERFRYFSAGVVGWFVRPLPPAAGSFVVDTFHSFVDGLGALRSPKLYLPIIAFSLMMHWAMAGVALICLKSIGLSEVPPLASLSVQVMLCLSSIIPGAPGNIGLGQYACILALNPFGVQRNISFAYSWVVYGATIIPYTLAGMIFLLRRGVRFRELRQQ